MSIAVWTFIQELSFPKRATIVITCAIIFGASLTTYVMFIPGHPYTMQILASCIKVPTLLLLCPLIALYPTLFFSRLFDRGITLRQLLKASFGCIVVMAICLALCAPLIALLNAFRNYTVTIFASYAAFAFSGLVGCAAFYLKLTRDRAAISSTASALKVSGIWLAIFGLVGAELGWSLRPIVGWTGQPFEWYRSDSTQIWDQLNAETQNLRVGGFSFPAEVEKPFKK
jgi:hypothetical protein